MRFDGTLKTWNDDRGFGFVEPAQGGQEIFVHVSAFPRDGSRPRLGEPLSFEIEFNPDGKKRAVDVRRLGRATPAASRMPVARPSRPACSFASRGIALAQVAGLGVYGYSEFSRPANGPRPGQAAAPAVGIADLARPPPAARFRCNGRTHCSQMSSCDEARFFLKNSPGVKMDGNNDGVPCEQQWCGR